MDIYVYSDESGVFDKAHNDVYVFGGIILLSKTQKEECIRKYKHAEDTVRNNGNFDKNSEIKGNNITPKQKNGLFRSLNQYHKFGAVIYEQKVMNDIFTHKKSKQRYLDYVYKIALKRAFQDLIKQNIILPSQVENVYIFVDEHSTATNGRYELREALEQEFKVGTFNYEFSVFYEPIFTNLKSVNLNFCNSQSKTLIRAADIVANNLFHAAVSAEMLHIPKKANTRITYFP